MNGDLSVGIYRRAVLIKEDCPCSVGAASGPPAFDFQTRGHGSLHNSIGRIALLEHMSQLMRQKSSPSFRVRRVMARIETNLMANGVGGGVHRPRRLSRLRAGMRADATEVVPKPPFHERSRRRVEWFSAFGKDFMDDRRRDRIRS